MHHFLLTSKTQKWSVAHGMVLESPIWNFLKAFLLPKQWGWFRTKRGHNNSFQDDLGFDNKSLFFNLWYECKSAHNHATLVGTLPEQLRSPTLWTGTFNSTCECPKWVHSSHCSALLFLKPSANYLTHPFCRLGFLCPCSQKILKSLSQGLGSHDSNKGLAGPFLESRLCHRYKYDTPNTNAARSAMPSKVLSILGISSKPTGMMSGMRFREMMSGGEISGLGLGGVTAALVRKSHACHWTHSSPGSGISSHIESHTRWKDKELASDICIQGRRYHDSSPGSGISLHMQSHTHWMAKYMASHIRTRGRRSHKSTFALQTGRRR